MDFNSQHQTWSRWSFRVTPGRQYAIEQKLGPRQLSVLHPRKGIVGQVVRQGGRSFKEVKENCARFGRKAFGSGSQMNIAFHEQSGDWLVMVRTEGHPAHDPQFVKWMVANWTRFFEGGFGVGTQVKHEVRFEAGDRQDGSPREQLLLLPSLEELIEQELRKQC